MRMLKVLIYFICVKHLLPSLPVRYPTYTHIVHMYIIPYRKPYRWDDHACKGDTTIYHASWFRRVWAR